VICEKSGSVIKAGAAAGAEVVAAAAGADSPKENACAVRAVISPAPVAPSTPAASRAATRRRGVEIREFMVCLSEGIASMERQCASAGLEES